jgi:hypothetical protein
MPKTTVNLTSDFKLIIFVSEEGKLLHSIPASEVRNCSCVSIIKESLHKFRWAKPPVPDAFEAICVAILFKNIINDDVRTALKLQAQKN